MVVSGPVLQLEKQLGYTFVNKQWLQQALMHSSSGALAFGRLEFLGDAVLGAIVARYAFVQFPEVLEGGLSRYRAQWVCKAQLAAFARALDLHKWLQIGPALNRSTLSQGVLADAFEAVCGAVFLDAGFEKCEQVVLGVMKLLLGEEISKVYAKDAKTRLQEWCHIQKCALPKYVVEAKGEQWFECVLVFLEQRFVSNGPSKKVCEQEVAQMALEVIEKKGV